MANRVGNRNMRFKNRNQQRRNTNTNFKKRQGKPLKVKGKVMDARQRILLKKRKKVTDARDVLTKIAKTQDARSKLLKIRETKKGTNIPNTNIRVIGSSILQKTDRNGKISLMTNKNKQSTSDMNLAIQQQLGLISSNRKKSVLKRQPINTAVARKSTPRNNPSPIRKTILNDFNYPSTLPFDPFSVDYLSADSYKINNMRLPPAHVVASPLTTRRHRLINKPDLIETESDEWHHLYSAPQPRSRMSSGGYIDLDAPDDVEEMPLVSPLKQTIFMHGTSRSSNVHSRLDTAPVPTQSHGIFSPPTKTKVVVPAGHRIVVSNLQQSVTQDDIRELFEDIGQLLVARLVRPGTAEVIYKNLKDAQKAVDTYHNRQLDGQPMKCLLVNKRPLNNPTGPAINPKQDTSGFLAALNKKTQISSKTNEKLVPDLQTIHKVLFQRN